MALAVEAADEASGARGWAAAVAAGAPAALGIDRWSDTTGRELSARGGEETGRDGANAKGDSCMDTAVACPALDELDELA